MSHLNSNSQQDRRTWLRHMAATSAGAYISLRGANLFGATATAEDKNNPHFFLQIFIPGGVDSSYLFDARPLAMTAEKIITNYRGKDAIQYTGRNGNHCLRTEITDSLMKYSDYFSVINGVMMSTSFDGHGENESYFLTGQPLGGAMLFDDITAEKSSTINAVRLGSILQSDGNNTCEGMLKLTDAVGFVLTDAIKRSGDAAFEPSALERLTRRLQRFPGEQGSRASSKAKMAQALKQIPDLKERMSKLSFPDPSKITDGDGGGAGGAKRAARDDIKTIINLFKGGVTSTAMYVFDPTDIDTHDSASAKRLPNTLDPIISEITETFRLLRETPFDDKRSMLDVTTIVIGSEFGRTMRQSYAKFEDSGTNHNPLTNTVLVGGKGIKSGMVIGASDLETVDAYKNSCSAAHKSRDHNTEQIMGKPFDFGKQSIVTELPAEFIADQYLHIGSVINTVYDAMGVPHDKWRSLARGKPMSPVISSLRS